ncbi:hypothetical protein DMP23_00205 [Amycolatopsis sp. A1MSW2902]|uniref:helix-turn-helix domain-containing protein n=1 Tax=Amycolatopsis sp. A1MSW2902 TaxID=687413 RepID=UPI003095A1C4
MANDTTGIGRYLRRLREERGLSQAETAHRAGITRESVSAIENGHQDPRIGTVRRYCDAIGARIHIGLAQPDLTTTDG